MRIVIADADLVDIERYKRRLFLMSKSRYCNRTKLLNLFTEKEFSAHTRSAIACLFKNISPERKEEIAELLYTAVKCCTTEKDALEKATQTIEQLVEK